MDKTLFQIRVTGILVENNMILLVKQDVSKTRQWSLPGGRLENNELLDDAIIREVLEETGVEVKINKLLYVCDKPDSNPSLIHITFLLDRVGGEITLPTNEFDVNPISDVRFVAISELEQYGFSEQFKELVEGGFKDAGNYMGIKSNIGL